MFCQNLSACQQNGEERVASLRAVAPLRPPARCPPLAGPRRGPVLLPTRAMPHGRWSAADPSHSWLSADGQSSEDDASYCGRVSDSRPVRRWASLPRPGRVPPGCQLTKLLVGALGVRAAPEALAGGTGQRALCHTHFPDQKAVQSRGGRSSVYRTNCAVNKVDQRFCPSTTGLQSFVQLRARHFGVEGSVLLRRVTHVEPPSFHTPAGHQLLFSSLASLGDSIAVENKYSGRVHLVDVLFRRM
jgi:hypothetical protein